ncbi:MAG TPA: cupin domain-containing protein [Nocardioidaceae bacterium]|nr:cupin domain-containing protein [Nocardioidaceae bacterium]
MGRRVHTAADVIRHARAGAAEMVVAPTDLLTPLARDVAHERGVRVVVSEGGSGDGHRTPRVQHVKGVDTMAMGPFPVDLGRPEMDVRLRDVLGAEHGLPMATGVMSLRAGSFPWTLDYDEVEYVIEGELHITTAEQQVVGLPGDVIAVPKGSSITFGTPSSARFLYVTYPADWGGTS